MTFIKQKNVPVDKMVKRLRDNGAKNVRFDRTTTPKALFKNL